jgi:hypothetical protein
VNTPAIRLHRQHVSHDWLPFLAWVTAGFAGAFGLLELGSFMLVALAMIVALLIFRPASRRGAFGVLTGAGAVSLLVAYVQRRGPGTISWHTATASGSDQYLDPRPWLAAGIALVLIGVGMQLWRGRASR